jgi:hypothetical protein
MPHVGICCYTGRKKNVKVGKKDMVKGGLATAINLTDYCKGPYHFAGLIWYQYSV